MEWGTSTKDMASRRERVFECSGKDGGEPLPEPFRNYRPSPNARTQGALRIAPVRAPFPDLSGKVGVPEEAT